MPAVVDMYERSDELRRERERKTCNCITKGCPGCKGECGCRKCHNDYADYLTSRID